MLSGLHRSVGGRELFGVGIQTIGAAASSLFPVLVGFVASPASFKIFSEVYFLASLAALISCVGVDQVFVRRRASWQLGTIVLTILGCLASVLVAAWGTVPYPSAVAWVAMGAVLTNVGNYYQSLLIFANAGWKAHAYTAFRLVVCAAAIGASSSLVTGERLVVAYVGSQLVPCLVCAPFLSRLRTPVPRPASNRGWWHAIEQSLKYFSVFSAAGIVIAIERSIAAHILSGATLQRYVTCTFAVSVLSYVGVGVERHLAATLSADSVRRAKRLVALSLAVYSPAVVALMGFVYRGGVLFHDAELTFSFEANAIVLTLGAVQAYYYFSVAAVVFRSESRELFATLAKIGAATMASAAAMFLVAMRFGSRSLLPWVVLLLYGCLAVGSWIRYRVVLRTSHMNTSR